MPSTLLLLAVLPTTVELSEPPSQMPSLHDDGVLLLNVPLSHPLSMPLFGVKEVLLPTSWLPAAQAPMIERMKIPSPPYWTLLFWIRFPVAPASMTMPAESTVIIPYQAFGYDSCWKGPLRRAQEKLLLLTVLL